MKINIIAASLLLFFFSACKAPRYAYSPSAHNAPVLTQKGDGKIGALYSNNLTGSTEGNNAVKNNGSGLYRQAIFNAGKLQREVLIPLT